MRIIKKLESLWFFSLIIFGIGVLLDVANNQLYLPTLLVFIAYCILYYLAAKSKNNSKTYH